MNKTFTEVGSWQIAKEGEAVRGDTFLSWSSRNPDHNISVLSDGLGSGVKANVLSGLTATMALKCIKNRISLQRTAEIIYQTLPVCSQRKISYATFTLAEIRDFGRVRIMEYENPDFLLVRDGGFVDIEREILTFRGSRKLQDTLKYSTFTAQPGDRIIMFSDGVTQAGLGTTSYPLGFGMKNVRRYIKEIMLKDKDISARELARKLVIHSHKTDLHKAKDDISCSVLYFRQPRHLLLATGPPFYKERDDELAERIVSFAGNKIISGGTTAQILSRCWNRPIKMNLKGYDMSLPPCSSLEGCDLVTEGIITLGKVASLLEEGLPDRPAGNNPALQIIEHFLNSDVIRFMVGTKINEAHQDPNIPVELEIRRNVIKKIKELLQSKYLKEVHIEYI